MKHYIIERLSWDTSGKEKETWKQCNKRDVEELRFVVEDLKEVGLNPLHPDIIYPQVDPCRTTGGSEGGHAPLVTLEMDASVH